MQGLARFAYTVLIGRFLGASELAHVSAWLALALILSLLWPTGAANAASHFLAHSRASGHTPQHVLSLIARSFWLSSLGMVVIGVPIACLWLGASLLDGLFVALLIVAYSGYILTRGIEMGLGRVARVAWWDIISSLVTMTLLIVVLVSGASTLLLLPITIGYAVFGVQTWITASRGHQHLDQAVLVPPREVYRLAGWNSLGLLASNGLIQLAMVFVFIVETPDQAGQFAAAMSLATPASMLAQAISQVLIPRFSEWNVEDAVSSRHRFRMVLLAVTGLLTVAFGVVWALSDWIVLLFFGPDFAPASPLLRLLLGGVYVFSIGLIASSYLITTGRTAQATVASLLGFAVGILVMLAGLLWWPGSLAACYGVLAGYVVGAALTVVLSLRAKRAPRP
ncbi:O-antigen/teichoic acid export membrane protein [Compostimonas suwonensis]|uniref:O-antigen/teichoic acid export membrane protein n=1 Tax=Compostimonas suwonensis TaxID=1048394 RepID=A0A2M9BUV3_9MICO|nr:O-antigen/teichoic acid export membrane protein [Compostimonas suwonensis]